MNVTTSSIDFSNKNKNEHFTYRNYFKKFKQYLTNTFQKILSSKIDLYCKDLHLHNILLMIENKKYMK